MHLSDWLGKPVTPLLDEELFLSELEKRVKTLGSENFFHEDYEATLVDTYGLDYEDSLVVEGGVVK